jgi:site-specific recombinase XerD
MKVNPRVIQQTLGHSDISTTLAGHCIEMGKTYVKPL